MIYNLKNLSKATHLKMTQQKNCIFHFKNSMANLASGISIVTIVDQELIYGITISSFDSVSLNPPLILFNIDKTTKNLEKYLNCETNIANIIKSV